MGTENYYLQPLMRVACLQWNVKNWEFRLGEKGAVGEMRHEISQIENSAIRAHFWETRFHACWQDRSSFRRADQMQCLGDLD